MHLYLSDPARRDAVRGTVADTIAEHQPAAVIAHSLGSVVTYETLWAHHEFQVDLLINPRLAPRAARHRVPPTPPGSRAREGTPTTGGRRWINIADPGDFIDGLGQWQPSYGRSTTNPRIHLGSNERLQVYAITTLNFHL